MVARAAISSIVPSQNTGIETSASEIDQQDVVDGAIAIGGGNRAHRDAEDQRQHHRGDGQHRGRGKAIGDQPRHALAPDVRAAEVAVQRAIEVARVLNIERLIEAQLDADRREGLRVGLRAGHRDRGIGGNHERDREGDERGAEQDRRAENDSPYEVGEHRSARDDPASDQARGGAGVRRARDGARALGSVCRSESSAARASGASCRDHR